METALAIAIISLCGTVITGLYQVVSRIRHSECGCMSCESHNNIVEHSRDDDT